MIETVESIREKLKIYDDPLFTFDEGTHTYWYNGKIMYGVTSFLKRFCNDFDREGISKRKAEKLGITQEELLKQWDYKRDIACHLGHDVHYFIENFYERNLLTMDKYTIISKVLDDSLDAQIRHNKEVDLRIGKFKKIYEKELNVLESIGSEIKVFSKKLRIAGTLDKLFLYRNHIIIGDWKSNSEIKTDEDYAFNNMLYPFEKLKENELNKYSLQTSLYSILLEEAGIDVSNAFICHLPPNEKEAKKYKMKDLRADLRTYFNHAWLEEEIDVKEVIKATEETIVW